MHEEQIIVSRENLQHLLSSDKFIIAVGTTSMRTLESLYWYGVKLLEDPESDFRISQQEIQQVESRAKDLESRLKELQEERNAAIARQCPPPVPKHPWLLLAAGEPKAVGEILNVGHDRSSTFLEVAEILCEIVPGTRIDFTDFTPERRAQEPGDFVSDIAKIRRLVGWEPKVGLREGLARTAEFYRKRREDYF